jgi:hypothetical protein
VQDLAPARGAGSEEEFYDLADARLADIEAGREVLVPLEDLMREYGLAD